LKDISSDLNVGAIEDVNQTLTNLLKICNRASGEADPNGDRKKIFQELIKVLITFFFFSSYCSRKIYLNLFSIRY